LKIDHQKIVHGAKTFKDSSTRKEKSMQGGHAMLKTIQRLGIDYIFSSPGSEWPPIWEALAQQAAQGITKPGFINCRHESLAVAMAAGYTKATGQTTSGVTSCHGRPAQRRHGHTRGFP
jgi:glyoxylate carboligase